VDLHKVGNAFAVEYKLKTPNLMLYGNQMSVERE
jgi:hypothetical protein